VAGQDNRARSPRNGRLAEGDDKHGAADTVAEHSGDEGARRLRDGGLRSRGFAARRDAAAVSAGQRIYAVSAYYNEIDPYCVAWLRELIAKGHIAPGDVDDRSIKDVQADDLKGYTQCHFFAGIGIWSAALRGAGWPDEREVWTGSCPCQPFSAAGKRGGEADERHLWPEFYRLIAECRPGVIFGEQVASSAVVGSAGKGSCVSNEVSEEQQSEGFDPAREGASNEEGGAFQSRQLRFEHSAAHKPRDVRSDRTSVQLGGRSDMGQSITGQDRIVSGVPPLQYSRGLPRSKQRNGGLGRAEDGGVGAWRAGQAEAEIERIIEAVSREFAPPDGSPWFHVVQADLEGIGYTLGPVDLPAAGVGAPHIRQRLWFLAYSASIGRREECSYAGRLLARDRAQGRAAGLESSGLLGELANPDEGQRGRLADGERCERHGSASGRQQSDSESQSSSDARELAYPGGARAGRDARRTATSFRSSASEGNKDRQHEAHGAVAGGATRELADADSSRRGARRPSEEGAWAGSPRLEPSGLCVAGPVNGFWRDAGWIPCTDGKARPVESGTFPLAYGDRNRVGRLRAYGNAINREAAIEFIRAAAEAIDLNQCLE